MAGALSIGYGRFGLRIEAMLLVSAAVSTGVALFCGHSWEAILQSIVDRFARALPAVLVLIAVGAVIGSWIVGGTIPLLVSYGLQIIEPQSIFLTAFIASSVVSLCTGTSWGSAGTIGVAMMGVAINLDVPLAPVAGAVVSGAYFGDKISPLSDTTNFAPAVCGTTLYPHIRHLLYTTVPGFVLSAIVFAVYGMMHHATDTDVASPRVIETLAQLDQIFRLNPILLLPPALVLFGAIRGLPALPLMLGGSVLGVINAILLQGVPLRHALNAMFDGANLAMFAGPNSPEIYAPEIGKLIERGGMIGMMPTVLLILCAFAFASPLTLSGALGRVLETLVKSVRTVFGLISATITTTLLVVATTADGKLALLIPGELFQDAYRRHGLHLKNLSRTVEDAGTIIEPLIPWTSAGLFMAMTLGVPTLEYLPWAVLCYTGILFALLYAATGFGIAKAEGEPALKKLKTEKLTLNSEVCGRWASRTN